MDALYAEKQGLNMDFVKDGIANLKSIGFGAAVPGLRDKLMNIISPDEAAKEEEMRRLAKEEIAAGRTPSVPMKKGGKVSSASKRADGCAIRGKTRA
jgi:hypothetical protein